jgi:hypothetical protein
VWFVLDLGNRTGVPDASLISACAEREPRGAQMKETSLIATPLIDGRADREFINGLIACQGLYHGWACAEGMSHISLARDLLAAQFLASGCDRLIFVDGDIAFTRGDFERLLATDKSLVSGMYPRKTPDKNWSFKTDTPGPGEPLPSKGLIPVRFAPCGFMRIERRVFSDMVASGACPEYSVEGNTLNHFFQTGVVDGAILPEDYYFCELARRAGHPPFVDCGIRLRHVGRAVYERKD